MPDILARREPSGRYVIKKELARGGMGVINVVYDQRTCGRKVFAAGEHLIRDGDDSKETYVIISGSVEVQRNVNGRAVTLSVMGPGEIVGEMAGITHSLRTATVIARDTTETLIITNNLMFEELQKLAPWMEKIVFSLAERVRVMSSHVHPILLEKRSFPII